MVLSVVPRITWKARSPRWERPLIHPVRYVFTAFINQGKCSSLEDCSVQLRMIQDRDMDNERLPVADIKYNFIVAQDGTTYEGRGWKCRPTIPKMYGRLNCMSLFIGFLANYDETPPTDDMYHSHMELIQHGIKMNFIDQEVLNIFYQISEITVWPYFKFKQATIQEIRKRKPERPKAFGFMQFST